MARQWYILQVHSGFEGKVKTALEEKIKNYMLISMELNDLTWHTIHVNHVVGFVGDDRNPVPLSDEDAGKIIGRIRDGSERPRPKVMFEVGEVVRVIDGPFANFQGIVDEVFPDKGRVRVMVSIFGRETPVELEFVQVSST